MGDTKSGSVVLTGVLVAALLPARQPAPPGRRARGRAAVDLLVTQSSHQRDSVEGQSR